MAMWGGRFSTGPNELVKKMSESVSYDQRMYAQDIRGSKAHASMLARQGIIPEEDAEKICQGLDQVKLEIDEGRFEFKESLEDIHMNVESRLTEIIGEAGAKLHSARSRNDQVATDIRLFLRDEVAEVVKLIRGVQAAMIELAEKHTHTIIPGFTHLQHAQPIVLGHYLLAYTEMLDRDASRLIDCRNRFNHLPLGAGALAGSTLPIDRLYVAEQLGFSGVLQNSMDAVSDRDFALELVSDLCILMMHISRQAEDMIFWVSQEAGWIELDDTFCTGSSLMPQKKNPDMCELARGKTARVYGDLVGLLTMMKNLPLCYNRDMQEDKERIFDALDTVKMILAIWAPQLATMKVNKERMYEAASDPALMATDLAEWLVKNGVPFRQAHHQVGHLVGFCRDNKKTLDQVTLEEMKTVIPTANEECLQLWKPENSVALRNVVGGTAPEQVLKQVQRWKSMDFMSQQD